jgi:hypothetical protein
MALLGIYTIPLILFTSLQLSKSLHRFIVKESMEQSILQKIVLAKDQIKWVDEGHEFLLNGEMFDLHSLRSLPDGLVEIACLSDKKEVQLNQQIDNLLISKKHQQAMLAKIIKIQSLTAAVDIQPLLMLTKQLNCYTYNYATHISTACLEVIKPPPQLSFFL